MSVRVKVNRNVLEMEYAVRGPIPKRAAELRDQGMRTIPCNIGNPQALGQQPISYYREVLALLEVPNRIQREKKLRDLYRSSAALRERLEEKDLVSPYVLDVASEFLAQIGTGMGAYTDSNGPRFIREAVAHFIDARDGADGGGGVKSDPNSIFLTNGASEAAKYLIEMLVADRNDGIMIPIPQYPLYSAAIRKVGGVQVNYYPDEEAGWALDRSILDESFKQAGSRGVTVKAIVVINPANPTGAILSEESAREVVDFAQEHDLAIIADEVYQENLYGAEFVSFARLVGDRPIPLFSLHSTSKGFYGECGHRGGYVEMRNPPLIEDTDQSFGDVLLKQASVSLCSNTAGQALTFLMVSPPEEHSEPYEQFIEERTAVLKDLYEKGTMIREAFKQMDDMECFGRTGAMYLFPRLGKLPPETTDFDYCMSLLESTGICTVNGSGFGQREGTSHLRVAFLPPQEMLKEVMPKWIDFHNEYVNRG
ncbi:MAG: aminotransferase class I/II-fold pyridoxal phosphate-dependent enzyme [Phycisphaerales bacterium]|nr:MAG: aminotransferase class I/II-fold pyridoxal phosphate-dependent enzyme [Phycisphaerales bacterium]